MPKSKQGTLGYYLDKYWDGLTKAFEAAQELETFMIFNGTGPYVKFYTFLKQEHPILLQELRKHAYRLESK